ncbi:hypothetical protein HAX54_046227 [Datura stramonium]|uniref:Uncharacterized protein n=1 Tax=Datura stramonium TaxID=4076 RepID=A0ABS8WGN1_DATST|nr:hypothetical protein [Datura stramonium]
MSCLASCCASFDMPGFCTSVASGVTKSSAKLAYCALFGVSLIVTWVLREVASPLLKNFSWINTSENLSKEWFSNTSCSSCFLSKFGAGLFLLIQVIILLDATHSWNDSWVAKDEQKWYVALLVVSVACYIATLVFSGILFMWFNPSGHDCGLNVFFIVMTMILAFAFAVIALHPRVNGSLSYLTSVISVYCAYVCYTGLSSEPRDYVCNGLHNKSKAVTTSTLVLGMLTTVLSVLYSALRAGSSTTFMSPPSSRDQEICVAKSLSKYSPAFLQFNVEIPIQDDCSGDYWLHIPMEDVSFKKWYSSFSFQNVSVVRAPNPSFIVLTLFKVKKSLLDSELESGKGSPEARPVSYSTFFHLIFALASMYSAMLLSGWTSSSESSELIDVGWTSVWIYTAYMQNGLLLDCMFGPCGSTVLP